ncbi:MAG TPA: hypothetical protein VFE47_05195 [Tepidisphaeraceae bacterium]|jgi:hypothetical protein|nr:hypothetical protein [Tepidisphaeraceae bacterium]
MTEKNLDYYPAVRRTRFPSPYLKSGSIVGLLSITAEFVFSAILVFGPHAAVQAAWTLFDRRRIYRGMPWTIFLLPAVSALLAAIGILRGERRFRRFTVLVVIAAWVAAVGLPIVLVFMLALSGSSSMFEHP